MISRYVIFEQGVAEKDPENYLAEFEKLEMAIDFARIYRMKHPQLLLEIRGVSYNRSSFSVGRQITSWGELPEAYQNEADMVYEDAVGEIYDAALEDMEDPDDMEDLEEEEPVRKRESGRRRLTVRRRRRR